MDTTIEYYKKMTPEQRSKHKSYLEKCLQVPDHKVGQMKWMWPYWKESLHILTQLMTDLGELPSENPQPVTSNQQP
jgi:hypothetical protein